VSGIPVVQAGFDPLGPHVRTMTVASGRTVRYIDEGDPDWPALIFFGGAGTTVRAFGLLEFARTLRTQLRIRVLSVERNGLGQTPFDPSVGPAEYGADVWSVLDELGVRQASVFAISGGGPYAARVASDRPERVRSVHIACAVSERLATPPTSEQLEAAIADPISWWTFPPDSEVQRVPGFADSVLEEATCGGYARGVGGSADGLRQAFELYRSTSMADLSAVTAPAFLYWGTEDRAVPLEHLERWRSALGNVREVRLYEGEGHDVQYRHWDQILTDVAFLGARSIVCHDGRAMLVRPQEAEALLERGATLGLCGWSD
jgi:non-heme chloroperoxidase